MDEGDRQPYAPQRVPSSGACAQVWWLEVADLPDQTLSDWLGVLDADERARAERFAQAADRRQFIAAHALLRAMLSAVAGCPPGDWRFVLGPHGKPALHHDHGLGRFDVNLSHTRDAVACGLVRDGSIGVDIEEEGRAADHLDLAEAHFAPSEVAQLRATAPAARGDLFVLLWTLKEAYIKATGQGLSMALDQFALTRTLQGIRLVSERAAPSPAWRFETTKCTACHRLSVALRADSRASLRMRAVTRVEVDRMLRA